MSDAIPIPILHLTGSLDPASGGVAEAIRQAARVQKELGWHPEMACVDPPEHSASTVDSKTRVPLHNLGPGRFGWAFSKSLKCWLDENLERFDVIIVHGLWLYPGFLISKLQPKYPEKVFLAYPHGMLDPWFQNWRRRPVKTFRNALYWRLVERSLLKGVDAILFTCEEEKRLAQKTFPGYQANEQVLPFGTASPPPHSPEMDAAFHEKVPSLEGRSFLLYLSRIHPKKGVDLLLSAYHQLLKEGGQPLPDLVIAGPGMEEDYGSLLNQEAAAIAKAASGPRVHFPGMLSGDSKWGAFYGCQGFVLPSHQENFGIVVAEAMACSRPVFISDKVNIWREIKAQGAGVVFPDTLEGTLKLLQAAVTLTSEQRAEMGALGRECFEQHFQIEAAVKTLNHCILDLLKGKNAG